MSLRIHAPCTPPPNSSEQTAHRSAEACRGGVSGALNSALAASNLLPDVEGATNSRALRSLRDALSASSPVLSSLGSGGSIAGALSGRGISSGGGGSSLLGGSGLVGSGLVGSGLLLLGGGLVGLGLGLVVALLALLGLAGGRSLAGAGSGLLALAHLLLHRVAGRLGVAALGDGLGLHGLDLGVLGRQRELLRLLGRVEGRGVELRGLGQLELGNLESLCVEVVSIEVTKEEEGVLRTYAPASSARRSCRRCQG